MAKNGGNLGSTTLKRHLASHNSITPFAKDKGTGLYRQNLSAEKVKKKIQVSRLGEYLDNLAAHRQKPIYQQLQKIIKKKLVEKSRNLEHKHKSMQEASISLKCNANTKRESINKSNLIGAPGKNKMNSTKKTFNQFLPIRRPNVNIKSPMHIINLNTEKYSNTEPIDWAKSPLYEKVRSERSDFNSSHEGSVYYDFEVNSLINKWRYEDSPDNMQEVHKKALNTFKKLAGELCLSQLLNKFLLDYSKV